MSFKFLIVDDHAIIRMALKQILAARFPKAAITEASHAGDAVTHAAREDWTAMILDISMPGRSGLDLLADIFKVRPKLPVLVYSAHPEEQFALRVLKAGASAFLTKESDPHELIQALESVLEGRKFVTPAVAQQLVSMIGRNPDNPLHESLSSREMEVFRRLAMGQSVKEIAAHAGLSVKTISTYRTRVLHKLELHTNADLVRYALRHQLID